MGILGVRAQAPGEAVVSKLSRPSRSRASANWKRTCAASQKARLRGREIWVPRAAFGQGPMDLRRQSQRPLH